MKQNKYDQPSFFSAYAKMKRSKEGLKAAGEWHIFKKLMPDFYEKTVLDLGCGYGWHCRYAREHGALKVVGVDISKKMIEKARETTKDPMISYVIHSIEDYPFAQNNYDVVISSLAFHYVEDFHSLCKQIYSVLNAGGRFVFSVEHPIFTARKEQDWHYDQGGNRMHWPVDKYQEEGIRETFFLGEEVVKYHRTISTYLTDLIDAGFQINQVKESFSSDAMVKDNPQMADENRRPMFLMISANK